MAIVWGLLGIYLVFAWGLLGDIMTHNVCSRFLVVFSLGIGFLRGLLGDMVFRVLFTWGSQCSPLFAQGFAWDGFAWGCEAGVY